MNLNEAESDLQIEEAAADNDYRATRALELCQWLGVRTYVPEPRRVHRSRWQDKPDEHRQAVLANRRRTRLTKSKHLQRSERCERSFAHVCDSGSARRSLAKRYREREQTLPDHGGSAQSGPHLADAVRHR